MNRSRTFRILLFVVLGAVILCAVFLPQMVASVGERSLLERIGRAQTEETPEKTEPDVAARLSLIAGHGSGERAVLLTEQRSVLAAGGSNAVLSACCAALNDLADLGLLPRLSDSAVAADLTCTAAVYSDPEDNDLRVTVWKISFSAAGHLINVWMDAQSGTVYCALLTNTTFSYPSAAAKGMAAAFGGYLGLSGGDLELRSNGFILSFEDVSFEFASMDGGAVFFRVAGSGFAQ